MVNVPIWVMIINAIPTCVGWVLTIDFIAFTLDWIKKQRIKNKQLHKEFEDWKKRESDIRKQDESYQACWSDENT